MKSFVFGFFFGISLLLGAGYLFLTGGGMPVATEGGPLPMERFIAHKALKSAIGKETDRASPIEVDETHLIAGAKVYRVQCAICHGVPGKPESPIASGMFPNPPQLFAPDKGVTDDPVGETFWKVKNGIRLTGMPGFGKNLTETDMWETSLLLHQADRLSEKVLGVLQK